MRSSDSPGLVVIHVDGLSHSRLQTAVTNGHRKLLERFDSPDVLARQLIRLNSFERCGDLVVFGAYDGQTQVNFEHQVGGHGSIGGDQLHPFVLARRVWGFDTTPVTNASELHPMLVALRDRGRVTA